MELLTLINQLKEMDYKSGSYLHLDFSSYPSNARKAYQGRVKKVSSMVARLGCDYANLKANENKVIGGLVGMQHHMDGEYSNYFIVNEKTNGVKLRVYTSNNPNHKAKTTYYLDGEEISFDELVELGALPPKKPNKEPLLCFDVKIENIINLGRC